MSDFSIRISQLDRYNSASANNQDFFPLVHSASMTTFRATLQDIGSMVTHSVFSDTASLALTASFVASASHAIFADTASFVASASHAVMADTASFVSTASHAITADTASFLATSSVASSSYSRFAETASFVASASHAVMADTASYVVSASHAVMADTASIAATASFFLGASTTAVTIPYNLKIAPQWTPYYVAATPITMSHSGIVVANSSGSTFVLTGSSRTNNRLVTGLGGIIGAFNSNHWYDMYWVYNSTDRVGSTVITDSGTTPNNTSFVSNILPSLPAGWDAGLKIGSVQDDSGVWRQWYEYGQETVLVYRSAAPANWGLDGFGGISGGGPTITHYFTNGPRTIRILLAFKNSTYGGYGYNFGDIIRAEDTLNDPDSSTNNIQAFGTAISGNKIKVWRQLAGQFWMVGSQSGGYGTLNASAVDMIIIAQ